MVDLTSDDADDVVEHEPRLLTTPSNIDPAECAEIDRHFNDYELCIASLSQSFVIVD